MTAFLLCLFTFGVGFVVVARVQSRSRCAREVRAALDARDRKVRTALAALDAYGDKVRDLAAETEARAARCHCGAWEDDT